MVPALHEVDTRDRYGDRVLDLGTAAVEIAATLGAGPGSS